MIIFAFKKRQLKEKVQDANFSLPIKNPESAIRELISDSKISQKFCLYFICSLPTCFYMLKFSNYQFIQLLSRPTQALQSNLPQKRHPPSTLHNGHCCWKILTNWTCAPTITHPSLMVLRHWSVISPITSSPALSAWTSLQIQAPTRSWHGSREF